MAYTLDFSLALGPGKTGLSDLRAQLVDTSGSNVGSAITTGFVEIGTSGNYLWHYTAFPDAHRGGVKFYSNAAPTVFLLFAAINPEEADRVDAVVSTRASQASVDDVPTNAELATALGTADDAVLAAIAGIDAGGATAAEVWSHSSRTLTQTAAQVAASVSGSDLTITRAVTFAATLTGLTIPPTWERIYLTVKKHAGSADSNAVVQIVESNPSDGDDGLTYLNRAAAATPGNGALTVNQGAGTVAILISDDATVEMSEGAYEYDVKALLADGSSTVLTAADALVVSTPTESV